MITDNFENLSEDFRRVYPKVWRTHFSEVFLLLILFQIMFPTLLLVSNLTRISLYILRYFLRRIENFQSSTLCLLTGKIDFRTK